MTVSYMQKTNEELRAKLETGSGGQNAQARLRDREGYIASLQVLDPPQSAEQKHRCSAL